MRFIRYTAGNLSLLRLSPSAKVSLAGGKALFSQLMFRTSIRLEGTPNDLSECLRLLRSGISHGDLVEWGKDRFNGFSGWVERALRAGVIE